MFLPTSRVRVYVCVEPVDMRKSFSGLCGVARGVMREDPLSGHVFCFFNRRRTYVKLLAWDRTGWSIFAKSLVRGTFGAVSKKELTIPELGQVLEGIELRNVRCRKRYTYLPE